MSCLLKHRGKEHQRSVGAHFEVPTRPLPSVLAIILRDVDRNKYTGLYGMGDTNGLFYSSFDIVYA